MAARADGAAPYDEQRTAAGAGGRHPGAAERGVKTIERTLAEQGPSTRGQLREQIAAAGVRTEGQALVHLLLQASLRGSRCVDRW